jgi:hypothetical protein
MREGSRLNTMGTKARRRRKEPVGIEERVAALELWKEEVGPMIAILHAGFPGAKAEIHEANMGVKRLDVALHQAREHINIYVEESLKPLRLQLKGLDTMNAILLEIRKKIEAKA